MSSEEQENQEEDYNQGYFNMPRELRAACAQVHKNTAQLVEFIAEQTFGWHSRWVYLTYDEIRNGRRKQNGERMGPGSYLTQDKQVSRAITDALDEAGPLIEVRYIFGQTAYAVHSRFWASSKLIPQWEFFKRTSWNPQDDPIPYKQASVKKTEGEQKSETEDAPEAKTSVKKTATDSQIDSRQQSKRQRGSVNLTEQNRDEAGLQEGGPAGINTSLHTSSRYNEIDTSGASADASRPHVDIENEKEEERRDAPTTPSAPALDTMETAAQAEDVGAGPPTAELAEAEKRLRAIAGLRQDLQRAERDYESLKRDKGATKRAGKTREEWQEHIAELKRLIEDEEAKG